MCKGFFQVLRFIAAFRVTVGELETLLVWLSLCICSLPINFKQEWVWYMLNWSPPTITGPGQLIIVLQEHSLELLMFISNKSKLTGLSNTLLNVWTNSNNMLKHSVIDCCDDHEGSPSSRVVGEKEWKNKGCAKADADLLIIDYGWYILVNLRNCAVCTGCWYHQIPNVPSWKTHLWNNILDK